MLALDQKPAEPSLSSDIWKNLSLTASLLLAYDFSILDPWLGIRMTRQGEAEAASAIITEFSFAVYLQSAILLAIINELPALFGQLYALEEKKAQSEKKRRAHLAPTASSTATQESPLLSATSITVDVDDQKKGDGDRDFDAEISQLKVEIAKTPKIAMIISLVTCLLSIGLMYASKFMLTGFRQSENIAAAAEKFFFSFAPFLLAVPLRLVNEFILISSGKQYIATRIAFPILLATGFLQYFFAPSLAALGLSTGINFITNALLFAVAVKLNNRYKDIHFFRSFISTPVTLKEIWKHIKEKTIPNIINMTNEIFTPLLSAVIAGWLPNDAVKIWSVAAIFLVGNNWLVAGSGTATGIRTGNEKGNAIVNDTFHRVGRAVVVGLLITLALQALPAILAITSPTFLSTTIVGNALADSANWGLMALTSLAAFAEGQRISAFQATRNVVGDTPVDTTVVGTLSTVTSLALAACFSHPSVLGMGLLGIPLGLAIGSLITTAYLYQQLPKHIAAAEAKAKAKAKDDLPAPAALPRSGSVQGTQETAKSGVGSWCCSFRRGYQRLPDRAPSTTPVPTPSWRSRCPC